MRYNSLKIERKDKVIVVALESVNKLNVLTRDMLLELRNFLSSFSNIKQKTSSLIILGSGERAFCAGGDIKLMDKLDREGARDLSSLAQQVTVMIESLLIPVIACVDGFALGGGCELAMSCDFIYATEASKFSQPETKIGLIPGFGGSVRLKNLVGLAMAKELIYTGREIAALEAQRIGLVNQVFKTRAKLLEAAFKTAYTMSKNSPNAIAVEKSLLNALNSSSMEHSLELEREAYGEIFNHPEKKEGIKAFLEKRLPDY